MKTKSEVMKACRNYLGNRGISDEVKRCAYHDGVWFIVFEHSPDDLELSRLSFTYEAWEILPSKGFAWNKANLQRIVEGMRNA
jgi:hypothetical protein